MIKGDHPNQFFMFLFVLTCGTSLAGGLNSGMLMYERQASAQDRRNKCSQLSREDLR